MPQSPRTTPLPCTSKRMPYLTNSCSSKRSMSSVNTSRRRIARKRYSPMRSTVWATVYSVAANLMMQWLPTNVPYALATMPLTMPSSSKGMHWDCCTAILRRYRKWDNYHHATRVQIMQMMHYMRPHVPICN